MLGLYCKSSGRRLLQHVFVRVACDSRDSRNMRLRESCATLVKFDEILPLGRWIMESANKIKVG